MAEPKVYLSAFLDEGVPVEEFKSFEHQLISGAAAGLRYCTPRFVTFSLSDKIKITPNLSTLNPEGVIDRAVIDYVSHVSKEYGFNIWCLGTPLGKSKLKDVDDGNTAHYKTDEQVVQDTSRTLEIALCTGAKAIRGFREISWNINNNNYSYCFHNWSFAA